MQKISSGLHCFWHNSAYYYDATNGQCQKGQLTCVLTNTDVASLDREIFLPQKCSVNDCGKYLLYSILTMIFIILWKLEKNADLCIGLPVSAQVTSNDKSSWSFEGSSILDSNAHNLITDGDLSTVFISDQSDQYPWIEIIMESSQIVKAVQLKGIWTKCSIDNNIS